MKKIILCATVSLLAACSNFNGFSQSKAKNQTITDPTTTDFVGNWECRMDGGVSSSNKVSLDKNGKATYIGNMVMPKEDPIFQYEIKRTGSWAYANHTLTYRFNKSAASRAHTEENQQLINSDAKIKETEQQYYNAITKQMSKAKQSTINLAVSNFAPNAFTIQQTVGETTRTGLCVRPN